MVKKGSFIETYNSMKGTMKMYSIHKLKKYTSNIMQRAGLSPEKSDLFAESLVDADSRGISSHGLTRLKTYAYRLETGLVDAGAEPVVLRDTSSMLLIDGNNALGVPSAMTAMKMCVEHAGKSGACFAAVRGGNHFGMAEFFTDYAARNNMIGIAMANGPAALAAIGGIEPVLGTNPLAVSIPAGRHPTMTLDMATSIVARGKVTLAAKEGRAIPEGWAIDAEGRPATDPHKANCMLPFGGAKGYGIGLIIEIMCSCLSGACNGKTMGSFYDFSGKKQDSGFFLGAFNVGGIMDIEQFKYRVDDLLDSIKSSPRAAGCKEVFVPGEIEIRKAAAAEENGISIPDAVLKELKEISGKYKVPFECEM